MKLWHRQAKLRTQGRTDGRTNTKQKGDDYVKLTAILHMFNTYFNKVSTGKKTH